MAESNWYYSTPTIFPGSSNSESKCKLNERISEQTYNNSLVGPTTATLVNVDEISPLTAGSQQYPQLSQSWGGVSGGREIRNHTGGTNVPGDGARQYYFLDMPEFKDLDFKAVSLSCCIRNHAYTSGSIHLLAYANRAAIEATESYGPNNGHGPWYGHGKMGIWGQCSVGNSMSAEIGYQNIGVWSTFNHLHSASLSNVPGDSVDDYFGYTDTGDFQYFRLDVIPWMNDQEQKFVTFRIWQAQRNHNIHTFDQWNDYTRTSAVDPTPHDDQDFTNKICRGDMTKPYDDVFVEHGNANGPWTAPINGAGSAFGFVYHDGSNYPGNALDGYARIGITNFKMHIIDQQAAGYAGMAPGTF